MERLRRYRITRITPGSTLRVSFLLGWAVALCPAACMGVVVLQILQRVNQAFQRVEPIELSAFGQTLLSIDFLEVLQVSGAAQTVAQWSDNALQTFVLITLLLMLIGAAVFVGAALLFSLGFNLLAALSGGLEIEAYDE